MKYNFKERPRHDRRGHYCSDCDLENYLIDWEKDLEWKKDLERCTWRQGSRRRPAFIFVINKILGEGEK